MTDLTLIELTDLSLTDFVVFPGRGEGRVVVGGETLWIANWIAYASGCKLRLRHVGPTERVLGRLFGWLR